MTLKNLNEEIAKFKELRNEVETTLATFGFDQENWRKERRELIGSFLADIQDSFKQAKYRKESATLIAELGDFEDNRATLEYVEGRILILFNHSCGYIYVGMNPKPCIHRWGTTADDKLINAITDAWSIEIKEMIELATIDILSNWLKKNMDELTERIKKANDWREEHLGGAA